MCEVYTQMLKRGAGGLIDVKLPEASMYLKTYSCHMAT